MLEEIRIRSLGVIDEAHVDLSAGFTVLSGETGAGKTMVLTALGLVLGQKSDASLVRTGADRLAVAATFNIGPSPRVQELVADQGGEIEGGSLVLARMVGSDGRSRALIGGASSTAGLLAEIGEELISVHAQMSSTRLLKPARQRQILDRFGKLQREVEEYHVAYTALKAAEEDLAQFISDRGRSAGLAAELRDLVERIDEVGPSIDEYRDLESLISKLEHYDDIVRVLSSARALLSDDNGASSQLSQVKKALDSVQGRDSSLDQLINQATEAALLVTDLSSEVARFESSLEHEPGALDDAHARIAKFQTLLRRFNEEVSVAGMTSLLQRKKSAEATLLNLDLGDERMAQLQALVTAATESAASAAARLSSARSASAQQISEAVTAEVRALAMPQATFSVEISRRADPAGLAVEGERWAFDASGIDQVTFTLAATSSTPPVPVAKGASGGELSRVMLAVEVVLAAADPVPTYIFDEVDAGVGGGAALEVGRRLARLARNAQVIVVTHLAQVAAFADHHIVVTKNASGSVTESALSSVTGVEREAELARMMAGLADSSVAQASAAELLALAAREK